MNISELSSKTGASARSLRYYEKKGLLKCRRLENGYRDFNVSMVERVKTIQGYLALGLNTDEISKIIECQVSIDSKEPICDKALNAYKNKLLEIENQLEVLEKLKLQLQGKISNFEKSNFKIFEER